LKFALAQNEDQRSGGIDVSEAKRLRTPEDENTRLKRLQADAMRPLTTPAGPASALDARSVEHAGCHRANATSRSLHDHGPTPPRRTDG
jgi:hypothetical protein